MRNIQQTIIRLISAGIIVSTYKTKSAQSGGRQFVSVGPYRVAVPDGHGKYAMIPGDNIAYRGDAYSVAQDFITFVGRDIADDAARRAYSKAKNDGHRLNFAIQK